MRRTLPALLCLLIACSSDDAVTPEDGNQNQGPPILMMVSLWDEPFVGFDYCQDIVGPPLQPAGFWAENATHRLEATLPQVRMRTGEPYELGFRSFFSTPNGDYVVHNVGSGTCVLTRFDNDAITGTMNAALIHQRNLQDTMFLTGSFTADPFQRSVEFAGSANGVPFVSDSGGETFPRIRARICVEDTTFRDGTGALVSITADRVQPDFLGNYEVDEEIGFTSITVESGGEFYNAVTGSLDIQEIDSIAVRDTAGVFLRYQKIIARASFECVGVNLIVFGDENKDTVRVREGRVSIHGLPTEN